MSTVIDITRLVLEFFAVLVDAFRAAIWPITLLLLVLVFRKYLVLAVGKVGRVRWGDFEAEFQVAEASPSERELSAEASRVSDAPDIDIADIRALEELALDQIEDELATHDEKVDLRRHIIVFGRTDLHFDGSALKAGQIYLFEVLVMGTNDRMPVGEMEAISARAKAVMREGEERGYEMKVKLVFLIVTSLVGDAYLKLERDLRKELERRRREDVRIYHETILKERESADEKSVEE